MSDRTGTNLNAGSIAPLARFGRFRSWAIPERKVATSGRPASSSRGRLSALLSPILLLAAWFGLSESGLFSQEVLVPPQVVAATLWEMVQRGDLQQNVLSSLERLFT